MEKMEDERWKMEGRKGGGGSGSRGVLKLYEDVAPIMGDVMPAVQYPAYADQPRKKV